MVTPEAANVGPREAKKDLIGRMIGAARLDVHTFEEVENDPSATTQALLVVIIVSLASGIGSLIGSLIAGVNPVAAIIFGVVWGIVVWAGWALVTFFVGTTLFKTADTHANWGQLARTTGFAQAPGVLLILSFIPLLGGIITLVTFLWRLVAMVVAVRQALDYKDTLRAVGVVVVSFIIVIVPLAILASLFGAATFGGISR
ncbi:MAG TPA: YIP1 family protein [Dehalococcoidia bacterium]|nr:YIP1 family protein [Dehalococcoidia bacterium]